MSEHNRKFPEFYVTAPQPCPYLPGRAERKIFTHLTPEKSPAVIDNLLKGGFRRSQNIAYMPYCDSCNACVSVRIVVAEFSPARSMRRILAKNADLTRWPAGARATTEQYGLFRYYIDQRHGDGGMVDMSVLDFSMMIEDSMANTFITEYRQGAEPDAPLVAVALCDRLSDGISLVYSFYESDMADRSLGTFMILDHVAQARLLGLSYVYLGYWISGSRKMDYKARFHPQERLTRQGWARVPVPEAG